MADRKKILVVDDEPDIVTYLTSLFEDNNYEVVSACDGQDGLDKIKSERPDLVTLDISMPEKSGVRFYREAREDADLKDIPIVIVTGVESKKDGGTGKDFHRFLSTRKSVPPPDGYVQKPVEKADLLGIVKKLLAD